MKRILPVLIVLMLTVCTACAELRPDIKETVLERTEALTGMMADAARSDAYVRLYLGNNEPVLKVIRQIAAADWQRHGQGTVFIVKTGAVNAYLNASGVSLNDFPESIRERVRRSVASSMPSAVISAESVDFAAAASVLRTGTTFLADGDFPSCAVVFLKYNDLYGVLCAFVKGENDTVSASLIPAPANAEDRFRQMIGLGGLGLMLTDAFEAYPLEARTAEPV